MVSRRLISPVPSQRRGGVFVALFPSTVVPCDSNESSVRSCVVDGKTGGSKTVHTGDSGGRQRSTQSAGNAQQIAVAFSIYTRPAGYMTRERQITAA